jgi:hypothetical protein
MGFFSDVFGGLFSSSYKTSVSTSVSRVLLDSSIVPSVKTGVINSVISGDDQLVENVLEVLIAGLGTTTERMYQSAKKNYVYGLPSAQLISSTAGRSTIEDIIRAVIHPTASVMYSQAGTPNFLHRAWMGLVTNHGYDSNSNKLGALTTTKGTPVYLADIVVVTTPTTATSFPKESLVQWGVSAKAGYQPNKVSGFGTVILPTPSRLDPAALIEYAEVSYSWQEPVPVLVSGVTIQRNTTFTESFRIELGGLTSADDYMHVKYVYAGKEGYWLYKIGSGAQPSVDALFATAHTALGSFFPFIYFRHLSEATSSAPTSLAYKQSVKLTKYIGMKFDDISEGIHANPDVSKIDQAFLTMSVPPITSDPVERQYLFDFFSKLFFASGGSVEASSALNLLGSTDVGRVSLAIQDSRFSMALSCAGVFKNKRTGVAAAVGEYTSSYANDCYTYSHQITDAVYEEVKVYDLQLTYNMWGGYSTVGNDAGPTLLIPLDHSITNNYTTMVNEILYARSLHYVINARTRQEVKWYQSEFFQNLIYVAAIVITVWTWGSDGGALIAAVAAGTMTLSAALMIVAMGILKQVVIAAVITLFVEAVGVDVAFIVAIAAVMYGGFKAFEAGSIKGSPTALKLLEVSSNLAQGISSVSVKAMNGLYQEAQAFSLLADAKTKELEEKQKLLETTSILSPMVFFGESPNDFYNRTVHAGNIGMLGIDSISSYVTVSLTLPDIDATPFAAQTT